jgi:hypothetical protein
MLAVGIDTRGNPVNLYTGEILLRLRPLLRLLARRTPSISVTSSKTRSLACTHTSLLSGRT